MLVVSLCKSQSQPSETLTVANPPYMGVLTLVSFNVLVSTPEMKVSATSPSLMSCWMDPLVIGVASLRTDSTLWGALY